jgi:hypothetical protein
MPHDPNNMVVDDAGVLDRTTYAGLKIYGELARGSTVTRGPLDIVTLQVALFTQCYDENVGNYVDVAGNTYCSGDIANPNLTGEQKCKSAFCMSKLYNCLGYKLIDLAEATSVYSFQTTVFEHTLQPGGVGWEFALVFDGVDYERIADVRTLKNIGHAYRIPPLSAKHKTLALMAAQAAFRKSGIEAGEAVNVEATSCVQEYMDDSGSSPSLIQFYAQGFGEATEMLTETTKALFRNQNAVASAALAETRDPALGQYRRWEAPVNSQTSSLKTMIGQVEGIGGPKACVEMIETDSQAAALDFLREAGIPESTSDSATDRDVIGRAWNAIQWDVHHELPQGTPSVEQILVEQDTTIGDISIARRYLKEEAEAVQRVETPYSDGAGQGRVYGHSARPFQHPPGHWWLRSSGNQGAVIGGMIGTRLNTEYAEMGTAQTVDYMRAKVNKILKDHSEGIVSMAPGIADIFGKASISAGRFVGNKRIEAMGNGSGKFYIDVSGMREGESAFVIVGEDGYRCMLEGTIDGAPCESFDLNIQDAGGSDIWTREGVAHSSMDHFVRLVLTGVPEDKELYVFVKGKGGPRFLAAIEGSVAGDSDNERVAMPAGTDSEVSKLVADATMRDPEHCGTHRAICSEIGLDRGFVPPLENELTDNSDRYENSWLHYLDLAETAAREADRLGEQLVDSSLQIDMRGEAARQKLEELCGGVLDRGESQPGLCEDETGEGDVEEEYKICDPGLAHCLPKKWGGRMELLEFVSLGRPACIFQWRGSGRVCACSETEAANGICTRQCPVAADTLTGDCTDFYASKGLNWSGGEAEGVDFRLVEEGLGVFDSGGEAAFGINCQKLDELRGAVEENADVAQAWREVSSSQATWLQLEGLARVARSLRITADWLHHYTVYAGGTVLWTTKVQDASDCPPANPLNPESPLLDCHNPPLQGESYSDWLTRELSSGGVAWTRKSWGETVWRLLFVLKLYTGELQGLGARRRRTSDYCWTSGVYDEDEFTNLPLRTGGLPPSKDENDPWGRLCEGQACACVRDDLIPGLDLTEWANDASIAPCMSFSVCGSENGHYSNYSQSCEMDKSFNGMGGGYGPAREFWDDEANIAQFLQTGLMSAPSQFRVENQDEQECYFADHPSMASWYMDGCNGSGLLPRDLVCAKQGQYEVLNPSGFIDGLTLACRVVEARGGSCGNYDPNGLPAVNEPGDLRKVAEHIECAASDIHRIAETTVVANLPKALKEGFQRYGLESYYPGYSGRNLQVLLSLEADLRRFGGIADNLRDTLFQIGQTITRVHLHREQLNLQERIGELKMMRNIASMAVSAANQAFMKNPFGLISFGVVSGLEAEITEAESAALDLEGEEVLSKALSDMAARLTEIRQAMDDLSDTYASIQSNASQLAQNQNQAAELWATIHLLDSDAAGHVLPVNTTMRRRRNTIRARYEAALTRAKKLAFIARRAIEFRLGVNMSEMGQQMTLVPPPKEWVDRVCILQGFDYERIVDPDDPLFAEGEEGSDANDHYAHMYVGDYVRMLRDFVESYSIDSPFSDERDIAVVSVRDDLLDARRECRAPSYNLLRHSGNFDGLAVVGEAETTERVWKKRGCASDDPLCLDVRGGGEDAAATCDYAFCFGEDPDTFDAPGIGLRLMDTPVVVDTQQATEYRNRPADLVNSGYFSQTLNSLEPGYYILSWWDRMPPDAAAQVAYRVEIVTGDATAQPLSPPSTQAASGTEWTPRDMRFELTHGGPVEIRIHPSHSDGGEAGEFGDVWVWGLQLEWVDPWRCRNYTSCDEVVPLTYQETDGSGITFDAVCRDFDGSEMRSRFERRCLCEGRPNATCVPGTYDADEKRCFRQYTKTFTLEGIESGELIPSHNVAIGNFNYRIEDIAVNLVGTNVRDCSHSSTPSTCNSNAFIPYTLVHEGEVSVRNYEDETIDFRMPTARVEHGKALAAEVLVTNPPSSTHNQLLGPYFKTGLKGRPLQGTYKIRIWETPELSWSAIEDVQLIFKYRYWTRMTQPSGW